jgi:hypothetical protein
VQISPPARRNALRRTSGVTRRVYGAARIAMW